MESVEGRILSRNDRADVNLDVQGKTQRSPLGGTLLKNLNGGHDYFSSIYRFCTGTSVLLLYLSWRKIEIC